MVAHAGFGLEFVVAVAVVDLWAAAGFDAGKLHCNGWSVAHCHYIAEGKQTVEGVEEEPGVVLGEQSLSCGDQVQGLGSVGVVKGKAAVVETCWVKSGAVEEDVRLFQRTSSHHGGACRIGRSLSSVGTVHTCFRLLVACPPCKCHTSH